MKLESHLGGHANITHIDYTLIDWVIEKYQPKTTLEIGCGPGGVVKLLNNDKKIRCVGIDGDYTLKREKSEDFILHDYTKSKVDTGNVWDWGYSCEFLEHVEEKYQDNYMNSFQQCKMITCTFATKDMPGYHHVNLRDQEYWVGVFEKYGFEFDEKNSLEMRSVSTLNLDRPKRKQYWKNTGLIFYNKSL